MRRTNDRRGFQTAISMVLLILGASLVFSFLEGGSDVGFDLDAVELRQVQADGMATCIREELSRSGPELNGTFWISMDEAGCRLLQGDGKALPIISETYPFRPDGLELLVSMNHDLRDPVLIPHVVSVAYYGSVRICVYLPLVREDMVYDREAMA